MKLAPYYFAGIVTLLLIVVLSVSIVIAKEQYYRSVFETCIRMSADNNGTYTEFDVIVCNSIKDKAKSERWFSLKLQSP